MRARRRTSIASSSDAIGASPRRASTGVEGFGVVADRADVVHVATPHPGAALRALGNLTNGTREQILRDRPELPADAPICRACTARYRRRHLEALLEAERGALSTLDHQVLDSLQSGLPVAEEPEGAYVEDRTLGERAADALARVGGSWGFILTFGVVLVVWMAVNVTGAIFGTFDPYPFILLNLALSTLAALQAPVIMMSQRRQEAKDRMFVTPAYAQAAGGGASAFATFIPLILIFAIMWFLLIRPQQKKLKEHRNMVEALRRGDQVVTAGRADRQGHQGQGRRRARGRDRRWREGARRAPHHRAGADQDRAGQELTRLARKSGGRVGVDDAGFSDLETDPDLVDLRGRHPAGDAEPVLRPGGAAQRRVAAIEARAA
jgi:hypothetical protein